MRSIRALPLLAAALTSGRARAETPTGLATEVPNLQLSSAFFQGAGQAPDNRNVLALVLTAQTTAGAGEGLDYGFSLGWLRMSQPSSDGALVTARVGNALVAGTYRIPFGRGFTGEVGLGLALGLTASAPEPKSRLVRSALGHAIAMQGICDAWLWAPGRGGFIAPVRLHHDHLLGPWAGRASLEGVFLATIPKGDEGESILRAIEDRPDPGPPRPFCRRRVIPTDRFQVLASDRAGAALLYAYLVRAFGDEAEAWQAALTWHGDQLWALREQKPGGHQVTFWNIHTVGLRDTPLGARLAASTSSPRLVGDDLLVWTGLDQAAAMALHQPSTCGAGAGQAGSLASRASPPGAQ